MMLTLSGIAFSYNGRPILRDVALSVHSGEIIALVGINGAGKSTLLKCVGGILTPRSGSMLINGRESTELTRRERARIIGYVPQRFVNEEDMTVFDAVLLGRRPHMAWLAGDQDYRITEDILRTLELAELALRPLSTLSGGEAQKVMIGRALAQEPGILILDEPTSNLDVKNQVEVLALLSDIARKNKIAVVVALHDLGTALRFADRIAMMENGTIRVVVSPEAVTGQLIEAVFGVKVVVARVDDIPVVVPLTT
jgi:iron complex transport system ATP-binding protein